MKMMFIAAALATTLVAGCKEEVAAASCTMEELQAKAMQVATGLQANPTLATEMMGTMQELAPKLQAAATSGEVDPATLTELCTAYDDMIAKL